MKVTPPRLPLFKATGVELEYVVVDASTLDIRPLTDELLKTADGRFQAEFKRGRFTWSNELVLHVVELKTTKPEPSLSGLAEGFQAEVREVNRRLSGLGARLMPTGMHPWMNPLTETRLWPHEGSPVYEAYDRIFGCRNHGYANLQSVHLNLPFANDIEFGTLHAAVRAVLPILPALAASSPVLEGRVNGWLDNRLEAYRSNALRTPSVTGRVIPERVYTEREYRSQIFDPMYDEIAPLDPDRILRDEFLNSRGAIARFDRGSIEIRLLDVQECPLADLAIAELVTETVRALTENRWTDCKTLRALPDDTLVRLYGECTQHAELAPIRDRTFLAAFGCTEEVDPTWTAQGLWRDLAARLNLTARLDPACAHALETILAQGPLARRILDRVGKTPSRARLRQVYEELCTCLNLGHLLY